MQGGTDAAGETSHKTAWRSGPGSAMAGNGSGQTPGGHGGGGFGNSDTNAGGLSGANGHQGNDKAVRNAGRRTALSRRLSIQASRAPGQPRGPPAFAKHCEIRSFARAGPGISRLRRLC
jgi:hypothetical protein